MVCYFFGVVVVVVVGGALVAGVGPRVEGARRVENVRMIREPWRALNNE